MKKKRSVDDDVYRFEGFLYEQIGSMPLVAFKLDDAERAMRKLDPDLSVATRRHYAQLISHVMQLTVYPAREIPKLEVVAGSREMPLRENLVDMR